MAASVGAGTLARRSHFHHYQTMEEKQALSCLAALAHETRLAVFRLLVKQGPQGMPAGEIAQRLAVPPPTLSFHLKDLERAGLIRATRNHRQIRYATDYAGTRALLDFLMRDCCQGLAELCGPGAGTPACCDVSATSLLEEAEHG
jgi:DNA-binding transcriptional ArsR family regulator